MNACPGRVTLCTYGLLAMLIPNALAAQWRTLIETLPVLSETQLQDSLGARLQAHILAQRSAWSRKEAAEHRSLTLRGTKTELENRRIAMMHCHYGTPFRIVDNSRVYEPDGTLAQLSSAQLADYNTAIKRGTLHAWICPNWIPAMAWDARRNAHEYDARVTQPSRLLPFPDTLLVVFDAANAKYPANMWIRNQRVRMLMEHGDHARARSVARECEASLPWCTLVIGFIEFESGNEARADSVFGRALERAPLALRCQWNNASVLLSPEEVDRYRGVFCEERAGIDRQLWWLSTPFFVEGHNRRRSAHLARLVHVALDLALPFDPFYSLKESGDQTAISEMLMRYGWAPHMLTLSDAWNTTERAFMGGAARAPFSAPEYDPLSAATVPSLAVAISPLLVDDHDFFLTGPTGATAATWWPREFFRHPSGAILGLRERQYVLLRRDGSALLVIAAANDRALQAIPASTELQYALMLSPIADSTQLLATATSRRDQRVFLEAELTRPGVIGLELLFGRDGIAGARTRFGVPALPTLRDLAAGGCALSAPVLATPAGIADAVSSNAFSRALGTTHLKKMDRIDVVWESYGYRKVDTVGYAISVDKSETRAGDVAANIDSPLVSIAWTNTSPGHRIQEMKEARVVTLQHEITLNLGLLPRGEYQIKLRMESRACGSTASMRQFSNEPS